MENSKEVKVGKVAHYFPKINVAIIEITDNPLKVGEEIRIKGHTTDITQKVKSMQIEHKKIEIADSGKSVGLEVSEPVRANDIVYKVL